MSHYFIDKQDPRVADLLRRLEKIDKSLTNLEPSCRRPFKGERFVSNSELAKMLKVSRRTLQEYKTARAIPYYLVQGKILYKESEIKNLLEAAHKKCMGKQKWV